MYRRKFRPKKHWVKSVEFMHPAPSPVPIPPPAAHVDVHVQSSVNLEPLFGVVKDVAGSDSEELKEFEAMDAVSKPFELHHLRTRPTEMYLGWIRRTFDMIKLCAQKLQREEAEPRNRKRALQRFMPQIVQCSTWGVFMFGSQTDGTCSVPESDVDIAIALNFKHTRPETEALLYRLSRIISKTDKTQLVKCILRARYPIIRMHSTETSFVVNVSIADRFVYQRNEVIKRIINHHTVTFAEQCLAQDPIRKLIVFVKHWSRVRKINDSFTGYLNSFGFLLFVIKFVQWFELNKLPMNHEWTLGELVAEFFRFYVCKFNWGLHCISVTRRFFPATAHGENIFDKKFNPYCVLQVIDPVNVRNNIGNKVGWKEAQHIKFEFIRAVYIFENESGERVFERLCDSSKDDPVTNCNLKFDIFGNGHVMYESFEVSKNMTTDPRYPFDRNVKHLLNPVRKG